ncbi:hypothetical protein [Myroides odoratimimus]|uniref:hypothetical protein n=1 Tax=Myroides odoratimimus TaxID=76832 RepID=UPI00257874CC|nr:hypothetical protein [Myroides odoratimimus]
MITKEQLIKEAWGVLYNDQIDKNGWFTVGFNYEYNHNDFDTIRYLDCVQIRPKQLQGIEDNNGWISISSEEDLPQESGEYWVIYNNNISHQFMTKDIWIKNNITHYQPIIKPKMPLHK